MLTDENIAKINEFLADRDNLTNEQLGRKWFGRGNAESCASSARSFVAGLRCVGVDIGRKPGTNLKEFAEFHAWKAQQQRLAAE